MSQNKSLDKYTLDELLQKARTIQGEMESIQNKLANTCVIGVAGNQEVQIKINGRYEAISTTISDSAYADKERLASLITVAINDATSKLELITKE
jgi:DNA-binding YbaB/EbfC family protein